MKQFLISFRLIFIMTFFLGLLYPLVVTSLGKILFFNQAQGSLILEKKVVIGSALIGQEFKSEKYFWSRPSANSYNALASGGTNLSPTSKKLQETIQERRKILINAHGDLGNTPSHLLFSSASGLDPHLDLESVLYQIPRVSKTRSISHGQLKNMVESFVEPRQWGFLGEPVVNVFALNRALDKIGNN